MAYHGLRSPNVRYLSEDEEKRLRLALDEHEAKLRAERDSGNHWREERCYELFPSLSEIPFADHLKPLVLMSLNTGARRGELYRLQWEDIDFNRKNLALVMHGKRKSHTRWENLKKNAKISNFRWHDMRHHFASRLAMNGVPLNTVRELLGHTRSHLKTS